MDALHRNLEVLAHLATTGRGMHGYQDHAHQLVEVGVEGSCLVGDQNLTLIITDLIEFLE